MADVFISYQRDDQARVAKIAEAIEREGFSVWWDQELPLGESYAKAIRRELDAASSVVVVWSATSIHSEFVQEEATLAKRKDAIAPVRIDLVDPPIGFTMVQTADLTDWNGSPNHEAWRRLIAHIGENVKRPVQAVGDKGLAFKKSASLKDGKASFKAEAKWGKTTGWGQTVGIIGAVIGGGGAILTLAYLALTGQFQSTSSPDAAPAAIEASADAVPAPIDVSAPPVVAPATAAATFEGLSGAIGGLAVNSTGQVLAVVGADNQVTLFDPASGRLIARYEDGPGMVVAFAPKGDILATGGRDGRVRVRGVANGNPLREMTQVGAVTAIAFSPDGERILTGGSDGKWRLWDRNIGKLLVEQDAGIGRLDFAAFDVSGQVVVGARSTDRMLVFAAAGGEATRNFDAVDGDLTAAAMSSDGVLVATGSTVTTYRFRTTDYNFARFQDNLSQPIIAHAISADNARVAGLTASGLVRVWDMTTLKKIADVQTKGGGAFLALTPAGDGVIAPNGPDGAQRFALPN